MEKLTAPLILYFGLTGFLSLVFIALTIVYWAKKSALIESSLKKGSRWKLTAYLFLFFGAVFLCGAIWKPGALLFKNPDFSMAIPILICAKAFFFLGWLFLLIGEIKAYKFFLSKKV